MRCQEVIERMSAVGGHGRKRRAFITVTLPFKFILKTQTTFLIVLVETQNLQL